MTVVRRRFVRDSLAGLLRTSSGAFLVLLVPPILIRQLGPTTYGAWAIAVEIGTYLGLLDLGALSAVGHFAARHRAEHDGTSRVLTTLLALEAVLVVVGAGLLALLVLAVPTIYPRLPHDLVAGTRLTLALVGGSSLFGLLATTWTGHFLSVGRLVVPSRLTFASRLVGTGLVIVLAVYGLGLGPMAIAWSAATMVGYLAVGWVFARERIAIEPKRFDRQLARDMVGFSGPYAVWIAAGLLVVGFDTTIVARIDFRYVAPFAAAAGAVSIISAFYNSALAPLVPLSGEMAAGGQRSGLTNLLQRITRIGGAAVVLFAAALVLLARPLLVAWVGAPTARMAVPILQVLVAANALRLIVMPYPVLLFGTGEHRRMRSTPLVEGVVNVAASIALGLWLGPLGVAYGAIVAAVAGIVVHLFANVPRTRSIELRPLTYLRTGMARPLLAALPVTVVALGEGRWPAGWWWPLAAASFAATAVACWQWALSPGERRALLERLGRRADSDPRSGVDDDPPTITPGPDLVLEPAGS